jgi:trehalose-6-phosphate synthase/hydroxymethylpyrimidine pyrophosphatase-like HAD family hydrolase
MRVLVADLDGTLLGGDTAGRSRLHAALTRHPEVTVVFATGRGLASVRRALIDPLLPRPRWIIADVGASVIDGADMVPVEALQGPLRAGWPGADHVRATLGAFGALVYQENVPQDGRCSFLLEPSCLTAEIADAVELLGCSWVYSADRFFDVLPRGASKGSALVALARELGWPMPSVLVAGDSLNDLSMFQVGARGVIVGNAEPGLRTAVPVDDMVHRARHPNAAGVLAALQELGWVDKEYPLVIGYHRPPVSWTSSGWQPTSSPNGILPTLLSVFRGKPDAVWAAAAVIEPAETNADIGGHGTGLPLSFVPVSAAEWSGYFHRACKDTLWPALMSQPLRMRFDASAWAHYRTVNARFADHISARAAPGGTVWLHDYNLWLVPGLLRSTRPDLRVGLFHHTPFPPPAVFDTLPTATELRASLACLDWAGFHTEMFATHFRQVLVGYARLPRLGVHPLGIDRVAIEALARARLPRRRPGVGLVVLSVERLDYAKAPLQKVEAIAALLGRDSSWHGHLQFRLVCPPPETGITAYEATRRTLERRIAEVNRAWRTDTWQPIEYEPRSLSQPEVVDNYLAADVFWITSLQDGMNLTAKEFVAAQAATGLAGVLVLSRYAGAAVQFGPAAVLTEPNSPVNLVDTLQRALTIGPEERRKRMRQLADLLGDDHPTDWAAQIIAAIQNPDAPPVAMVKSAGAP